MIGRIERERQGQGGSDKSQSQIKTLGSVHDTTMRINTTLTTVEDLEASMGRLHATTGYNDPLVLLNYSWQNVWKQSH